MINDGRRTVVVAVQIHKSLSAKFIIGETLTLLLAAYLAFIFANVFFGMLAAHGSPDEKEIIRRRFIFRLGIAAALMAADIILNEFLHGRSLWAFLVNWYKR